MTACEIDGESNRGLGRYKTYEASELENRHNRVVFNAKDGDPFEGEPVSVTIWTACNDEVDGKIVDAYTKDKGSYFITLETKYACPTFDPEEDGFDPSGCTYRSGAKHYDLSPLMGVSLTHADKTFNNEILFNVCADCGVSGQSVCINTYDQKKIGAGATSLPDVQEFSILSIFSAFIIFTDYQRSSNCYYF